MLNFPVCGETAGAGGPPCRKCSPSPPFYSGSDTANSGTPFGKQGRCFWPPRSPSYSLRPLSANPAPAAAWLRSAPCSAAEQAARVPAGAA